MSARYCLLIGATSGAIGVSAGAFGAHALETRLEPKNQAQYETAVRYLMYHALAIVGAGLIAERAQRASRSTIFFLAGCLLFSGCLAAHALSGVKEFAYILPVGGFFYIIGWLLLAYEGWRSSKFFFDLTFPPYLPLAPTSATSQTNPARLAADLP